MKNNKDYIKWGLTAFFVVLGGFASYYVIFNVSHDLYDVAKSKSFC